MDAILLKQRIDYIEALEKIKLIMDIKYDEDSTKFILVVGPSVSIPSNVADYYGHLRQLDGALPKAIQAINDFAKQTLQPLIDKQKELIKKDI